jgi:hypothetical protein
VFSALGAVKIKTWVWRTPRRETPTTSNHELKDFTLVNVLGENLKTTSSFRDSGRVNSRIKVSDLRDPEVKQKERTFLRKWTCFESRKSIAAYATRLQSFQSFGGEKSKGHL